MSGSHLDRAWGEIRSEDDEIGRRLCYAALVAGDLHIALEQEASGDAIAPLILETSYGRLALAFDSESRLGTFLPNGSAYATLPGRELIAVVGQAGLGLAVNADDSATSMVLPPEVLDWITAASASGKASKVHVENVSKNQDLPEPLLRSLPHVAGLLCDVARDVAVVVSDLQVGGPAAVIVLFDVAPAQRSLCFAVLSELAGLLNLEEDLKVAFVESDQSPLAADILAHGVAVRMPIGADEKSAASRGTSDKPPRLI